MSIAQSYCALTRHTYKTIQKNSKGQFPAPCPVSGITGAQLLFLVRIIRTRMDRGDVFRVVLIGGLLVILFSERTFFRIIR